MAVVDPPLKCTERAVARLTHAAKHSHDATAKMLEALSQARVPPSDIDAELWDEMRGVVVPKLQAAVLAGNEASAAVLELVGKCTKELAGLDPVGAAEQG